MIVRVKVDAGICGFKTGIKAVSEDRMNVELTIGSTCDTIKELAQQICAKNPINAYQELYPTIESVVLQIARPLLIKKGCCEACVVPVAICKAMQVAAGLALPRDVHLEITQDPG